MCMSSSPPTELNSFTSCEYLRPQEYTLVNGLYRKINPNFHVKCSKMRQARKGMREEIQVLIKMCE